MQIRAGKSLYAHTICAYARLYQDSPSGNMRFDLAEVVGTHT